MALTEEQMIERVRTTIDAFNRRDFDAAVSIAHPEVVFVRPGGLSELQGMESFRAWMEPDAFESQHLETLDVEVEGDRVLTRLHAKARGAGSGIEVELNTWSVWRFDEDGLVTRVETYTDQEEDSARRALSGD